MITVADLIALLKQFPGDLRVVTPGFDETGIDDIAEPRIITVAFDVQERTAHFSPHEESGDGQPAVIIDF